MKIENYDDAIEVCQKYINKHRNLSYFILLLICAYTVLTYQIIFTGELKEKNDTKIRNMYAESYDINIKSYEAMLENLRSATMLSSDIRLLQVQLFSTNNDPNSKEKIHKYLRDFNDKTFNIIDSINKNIEHTTSNKGLAKESNSNVVNTLSNQDTPNNIFQYLKYLLNFIVIGILIFIYKFHLNQSKHYEHNMFALTRIKLANLSEMDEKSKQVLRIGAFNFYSDVKKGFSSPLDGHPASDLITDLLNKILDKLDNFKK